MSQFKDLVKEEIKKKLLECPEYSFLQPIKEKILNAINEGKTYTNYTFDPELSNDGLLKMRAILYNEFGFDIQDISVNNVIINFEKFL